MDTLGLYLSVPFCRAKCSFCNFSSDAFAPGRLPLYVDRLCGEIASTRTSATRLVAGLPDRVDTLYLGGGTPSLLSPPDVRRIFAALRDQFAFTSDPEITVECAPNQLSPETLEEFQTHGVNRLSFGVQSFVDRESAAIGRLHTAADCLAEIQRVRSAGVFNLSLDLIAGLPHQTEASWRRSVDEAIAAGVPHLSVYMLEVDDESRLGREILAHGPRYGAAAVPSDDDSAAFYEIACDLLGAAGIAQYEISNFARPGFRSVHNLRYWQRLPYLGFGLDAHSMLGTRHGGSVRFANTGDLDVYLAAVTDGDGPKADPLHVLGGALPRSAESTPQPDMLSPEQIFEETIFLGLRTNDGLRHADLRQQFGDELVDLVSPALSEAAADGLLTLDPQTIRLTPTGRVLSNEVFSRLLLPTPA